MAEEASWYVVHTYSGYENKVKTNIEKTIENAKRDLSAENGEESELKNLIRKVCIPQIESMEIKNGTKKPVTKKLFPGYVLINMVMNDDTWYIVRNTRGVTGFVGPGSKPVPLTEAEVRALGVELDEDAASMKEVSIDFAEGDSIKVISGAWKDTVAVVQKIDMNRQTATINVELFNRETPVEISFSEISSNIK